MKNKTPEELIVSQIKKNPHFAECSIHDLVFLLEKEQKKRIVLDRLKGWLQSGVKLTCEKIIDYLDSHGLLNYYEIDLSYTFTHTHVSDQEQICLESTESELKD